MISRAEALVGWGAQRTTSEVVEKNMSYQKYLETVLDVADEYHEINDLLNRYTTLEVSKRDELQLWVWPRYF